MSTTFICDGSRYNAHLDGILTDEGFRKQNFHIYVDGKTMEKFITMDIPFDGFLSGSEVKCYIDSYEQRDYTIDKIQVNISAIFNKWYNPR